MLASLANAEALARRLRAPCVVLEGAHFLVRECAGQINALLAGLVFSHQHFQVRHTITMQQLRVQAQSREVYPGPDSSFLATAAV